MEFEPVPVTDGQKEYVKLYAEVRQKELLLRDEDEFRMEVWTPDSLEAPVAEGEMVGTVIYYVNGEILDLFPICAENGSRKIDYRWCLEQVLSRYFTAQ